MNVLFTGSSGLLSLIPLTALNKSKYKVCAIATNEVSDSELNAIQAGTLQSFSFNNSIPLINLNNNISSVISQIEKHQPDVIFVSCYNKLIPQSILSLAKLGAFNLHPSLLPRFRGPTPLFWQFRDGISDFGITLHRINSEFDQGNIVAYKIINMDDGVNIHEATKLIANIGSQLILDFLDVLNENKLNEISQDNSISSYQSFPTIEDYRVEVSWTAKRIYNFINAYKESNIFFLCEIDGREYKLVDALSYQTNVYTEIDGEKHLVEDDVITFACADIYIQCKIKID